MGMPELRPKQDCTSRWNSTFYMLKRFYESKDAIISTLAIVNALVDPLTQEEWEEVEEACRVLESFEQVTLEISGERFKKLAFSDARAIDEALQRITSAASDRQSRYLSPALRLIPFDRAETDKTLPDAPAPRPAARR
ncbi:unnamed protein product, partial [Leuciscus chuanchicus]